MRNFIKKLVNIIFGNKNKNTLDFIKARGTKYSSSTGKQIISATATVNFNTKTKQLIDSIKSEVEEISANAKGDPEYILNYLQEQQVPVYKIKYAAKKLKKINEHTGFIGRLEGTKALYINTITGKGLSAETEPMFILDETSKIDYYGLIREFYLWYSMNKGLDGFDFATQELFKRYMTDKNPRIDKLTFEQMCGLQAAIARDSEANNFVIEIISRTEGGKNVIQEGNAEI